MTATSLYPEAAAAAGMSMPALCGGLRLRAHACAARRAAWQHAPCQVFLGETDPKRFFDSTVTGR